MDKKIKGGMPGLPPGPKIGGRGKDAADTRKGAGRMTSGSMKQPSTMQPRKVAMQELRSRKGR